MRVRRQQWTPKRLANSELVLELTPPWEALAYPGRLSSRAAATPSLRADVRFVLKATDRPTDSQRCRVNMQNSHYKVLSLAQALNLQLDPWAWLLGDKLPEASKGSRVLLTTRKWTLAEYQKLSEIGLLAENERIELIQGDIVAKTPVDPLHANAVAQANPRLVGVFGATQNLRVQLPLQIGANSQREPDFCLIPLAGA